MKKLPISFISILFMVVVTGCANNVVSSNPVLITESIESTATFDTGLIVDGEDKKQVEATVAMVETAVTEAPNADEVISTKAVPSSWKEWPVLPEVSDRAREVYQLGQHLGRDPRAFSVFGDCQSLPDIFMGLYDDLDYHLPSEYEALQDAKKWYAGSFSRQSVTLKKGTTVAAILWEGWIDEVDSECEFGETPLECEIRIHNPSIVIINLGTHWELRNGMYLRKIIELLLAQGIVPIVSTKADSREGEGWVNEEIVSIASEYQVPVWNFWLAAQETENGGMKMNDPMYLNDEGLEIHRLSGLQALDAVWQALNVP